MKGSRLVSQGGLDRLMDFLGKIRRKSTFDLRDRFVNRRRNFFYDIADQSFRQPGLSASLDGMPRTNAVHAIVPVLADRHRKLHLLAFDLARIKAGLRDLTEPVQKEARIKYSL